MKNKFHSSQNLALSSASDKFRMEKRKKQIEDTLKQRRSLRFRKQVQANPEIGNYKFKISNNGLFNDNNWYMPWKVPNMQNQYQNLSKINAKPINFNVGIKKLEPSHFQIKNAHINNSQINNDNIKNYKYYQHQIPALKVQRLPHNQNIPLNNQLNGNIESISKQIGNIWKRQRFQERNQNLDQRNFRKIKNQPPVDIKNKYIPLQHKTRIKFRNYVVFDKILGSGTYSKVYLGMELVTQKKVAVKQISELQQNQIKCLMSVNSQHVIQLQFHWKDINTNNTYLILDLCKCNLREQLKHCDQKTALKYFSDVMMGMEALAQKSLVHRDLKFQNILISYDGIAKITDFGLAKNLGNMTNVASVRCGTPYTMAPQILFHNGYGKPRYSHKCDVWSIGVILHEILYRKHPFNYDSDRVYKMDRVSIPRNNGYYDFLIDRSLVKSPENRISLDQFLNIYKKGPNSSPHLGIGRFMQQQQIKKQKATRLNKLKKNEPNKKDVKNLVQKKIIEKSRSPLHNNRKNRICLQKNIKEIVGRLELENQNKPISPKQQNIQENAPKMQYHNNKGFFKAKRQNMIRKIEKQQNISKNKLKQNIEQQPFKVKNQIIDLQTPVYQRSQNKVLTAVKVNNHHSSNYFFEKLTMSFIFFGVILVIAKLYDL